MMISLRFNQSNNDIPDYPELIISSWHVKRCEVVEILSRNGYKTRDVLKDGVLKNQTCLSEML